MTRKSLHMKINRESDLASLIPGDRVDVKYPNDSTAVVILYEREAGRLIRNPHFTFVEIPEGYDGNPVEKFSARKSQISHIKYWEGRINLDTTYLEYFSIEQGTPQYDRVKTLIDNFEV